MEQAETSSQRLAANPYGLRNVWRVLTRRRKWILTSILLCEFAAVLITLFMRPVYEATATIELNKGGSGSLDLGLGDALGQQLTSGGEGLLTDLQTETAILQGDSLALAVIQRLGLASQPPFASRNSRDVERGLPLEEAPVTRTRLLRVFKHSLKVNPVHGTRLIKVTFESHDPRQAAEIANAMIDSYKSQYLQSHYDATSQASDWLTKQLSDLKKNVEESEEKLTAFEKDTGILSLNTMMPTGSGGDASGSGTGTVHSVVIQKLDALNNELTAAEANRIEKEAIYRLVQSGQEDVVLGLGNDPLAVQSKSMVLNEGGGLSNLQQLLAQRNQLKIALSEASNTYGANNRHLKDLQNQVRAVDEQAHQELLEISKRAQADFRLAQQTENAVHRQFDAQQVAAGKLNEKAVEFAVLSQEAYSRKKLYEDLYTKLQEANVSAGIKATNITVVDPARSQSIPIRPKHRLNLELGMFLGVVTGIGMAFAVDGVDRTVVNPLEVEELTGVPVIGIIPTFGNVAKGNGVRRAYGAIMQTEKRRLANGDPSEPEPIWMLQHPESIAAESFRALRTSILLSRPGGGPSVVLITSCVPSEGKSTVSANLAISFAQHGKRVIIIEADMRRPTMKHVMDVSNHGGLSGVLAGTLTIEEAILREVQVPRLDVLPAGPRPPMPSEMLGSPVFDELLVKLRERYDIVVIDSPPALLLTDAVSIAIKTDATVWVARAGSITRPQLLRAAQMIERNSMPIIGFVLNRMDSSVDPYGYGYSYGYGYGYKHYGAYYGEENADDE